ncbi:hypothetical protein SIID45300_02433 [Candidatus Magnetaquicoccaceae bacterium FCR-1]|uniref:DUF2442 domain-containing protein n=1 Tax=Candidatus Magnetaquiglobus chichijimensis TaxID=3141448 RepID=A0ABQ0CB34_9PROT
MLHITDVAYLEEYRLWLAFDNGVSGQVDLGGELWGEMFAPLLDRAAFAEVALDRELGTIAWKNGADLAPEYLLERLQREEVAA